MGSPGPGEMWIPLFHPSSVGLELCSPLGCASLSSCGAAAWPNLSSGWKDPTVCLWHRRRAPGYSALNTQQML